MICKRRFLKKPVALLLLVILLLTFYIYTHNYKDSRQYLTDKLKYYNNKKEEQIIYESVEGTSNLIESHEKLLEKFKNEQIEKENENEPFKRKPEKEYTDFLNFKVDFSDTPYTAEELRSVVDDLNSQQIVYNADKFPTRDKDFAVIVVQVHKRIEYFKELLDSLQRTKGIENAILVISHDFYADSINELIRRIKFCQVLQIFFPYSTQLYSDKFPGPSPNDCPRDISKPKALAMGCENAETPDTYGHYREAHITMTKHHWWWKINMVMDKLDATKNHAGPIMFIEEDHYMTPSFYHSLMQLHKIKQNHHECKGLCDILTIGSYEMKEEFERKGSNAKVGTWISTQHNMGMALYRDTWMDIRRCAQMFCTFDDYNWDWSLMQLSEHCLKNKLSVLVYEVPRMYHIGDCGLHHTKDCQDAKATLTKVKGIIERNRDHLFHDRIDVRTHFVQPHKPRVNGGWSDLRDTQLCMSFLQV